MQLFLILVITSQVLAIGYCGILSIKAESFTPVPVQSDSLVLPLPLSMSHHRLGNSPEESNGILIKHCCFQNSMLKVFACKSDGE